MLEIEAKLSVRAFGPLRGRLRRLGARRLRTGGEENVLFDTRGGRLRRRRSALRLREDGRTLLTFKGQPLPGRLKRREELEVEVSDARAAARILGRLGFRPAFAYRKEREEWALGPCHVCLDAVRGLGRFVEVEGPSDRRVEAAITRLGLAKAPRVSLTYVELLNRQARLRGSRRSR